MTPYELSLLIHFETTPDCFRNDETELYADTVEKLRVYGVIEHTNGTQSRWQTTEKGRMWLQCILNTPMPTQVWVDHQGCKINLD